LKKIALITLILVLIASQPLKAQRGGESLFGLLHLTHSARVASLGGNQVGLAGQDLAMLIHNPAMLDSTLTKMVSMGYVPYLAGIKYGYGGIAWHFNKIGSFALGFQQIGYGDLTAADEAGTITGSFTAGETVIQLSYSRPIGQRFTTGLSLKPVFSTIEAYNSFGLAMDAGLFYRHSDGLFTAGVVVRNFGKQITSYSNSPTEWMRPDLQFGLSKKLAHAPFRLSLTAQDLLSGSMYYTLPDDESGNNSNEPSDTWGAKMMRHLIFGLEFVPTKNFYVAAGYNPRRRHDLKIENRASTVGFTWGFGVKIYKFHFSYGSARYHLSGSSNHFSISTNLSSF
jgi:hypothetical protein